MHPYLLLNDDCFSSSVEHSVQRPWHQSISMIENSPSVRRDIDGTVVDNEFERQQERVAACWAINCNEENLVKGRCSFLFLQSNENDDKSTTLLLNERKIDEPCLLHLFLLLHEEYVASCKSGRVKKRRSEKDCTKRERERRTHTHTHTHTHTRTNLIDN